MGEVPEFRKYSGYTAFIEGWGLYAESLGGELGLYKDPYSGFGALTFEMWRAVRLVVDTGIHAFGWSREKALQFMIENTGKDEHDATVEIDRYIVWPGQALAYKIGQLKIQELRAEAARELGGDVRHPRVSRHPAGQRRVAARRARSDDERLDRSAEGQGEKGMIPSPLCAATLQ